MKHGHHHFECRLVQLLMFIDGNTTTIIGNTDRVILAYNHLDIVAVARKSLIDRVINDFRHQMVQTLDMGVTNIHGRTLAYGFKTFEHLNIMGRVISLFLLFS